MSEETDISCSRISTITLKNKMFQINADQGIKYIALKPIADDVFYKGTGFILTTDDTKIQSTPQKLDSIYEVDAVNPIHGFLIDASAGEVEISILR